MNHIPAKRTGQTRRVRTIFDPVLRDPAVTEENPHGVRRPGKTIEDRLPVDQRPRVQAWRERQRRS